jgi:hypothetical protein
MFKEFSGTLYDLFGCLFPGLFTLAALALATWALFYPTHIAVLHGYDATLVTAVVGAGYVFGHVVQAVARMLEERYRVERKPLDAFVKQKARLFDAINEHIAHKVWPDNPPQGMPEDLCRAICDRSNAAAGITGDHDVYLYRKDFYRGMFLSMALLAAVLLIVAARGTLTVQLESGIQLLLNPYASFVWCLLCASGAFFCWERYTYFCTLSVEESFLTFAAKQFLSARSDAGAAAESDQKLQQKPVFVARVVHHAKRTADAVEALLKEMRTE